MVARIFEYASGVLVSDRPSKNSGTPRLSSSCVASHRNQCECPGILYGSRAASSDPFASASMPSSVTSVASFTSATAASIAAAAFATSPAAPAICPRDMFSWIGTPGIGTPRSPAGYVLPGRGSARAPPSFAAAAATDECGAVRCRRTTLGPILSANCGGATRSTSGGGAGAVPAVPPVPCVATVPCEASSSAASGPPLRFSPTRGAPPPCACAAAAVVAAMAALAASLARVAARIAVSAGSSHA
mmetsp:Transcript_11018/g.45926  ORF Transcript_11018/g.45926 Transcript_11018/m.45926 type:complete len:245 (-) Transcript_11018:917-1651(-)